MTTLEKLRSAIELHPLNGTETTFPSQRSFLSDRRTDKREATVLRYYTELKLLSQYFSSIFLTFIFFSSHTN